LLSDDAPYKYETREILAQSHRRIACLLRATDPAAAVQEYETACREHRALSQKWSDDVALQVRLAKYLIEMGVAMRDLHQPDEALTAFDEARRVCEGANLKNDHDRSLALRQHADACFRIGQIHARIDANVAYQWYRTAINSLEQCLAEQPYLVVQRLRLAQLHTILGRNHRELHRWGASILAFNNAVEQYEYLLRQDPTNEEFRSQVTTCRNSILEIQRVREL
jgi:tetratricopeptide (TPR) repeat protein